ncbi:hypothetical protein [Candidatus Phytoplasma prunorum]|uniref:hypothetical protein n=1 Tax=Candidatus Phytoplasma prunorum TaxID=47565 RepID=UPI002FF34E90
MLTTDFKNKKNQNISFFIICLLFLTLVFISNVFSTALSLSAATNTDDSINKPDFQAHVKKNTNDKLYIGPIEIKQFEDGKLKLTEAQQGQIKTAILTMIKLSANDFTTMEFVSEIEKIEDKFKITLTLSEAKKKNFSGESSVTFEFDNDLGKLKVAEKEADAIYLTYSEYEILNNYKEEDAKDATKKNKYDAVVEQIINKMNSLNSLATLSKEHLKITVFQEGENKIVKLESKETGEGNNKFSHFSNSKTIKLEVSPKTKDLKEYLQENNNNDLYIGPIKYATSALAQDGKYTLDQKQQESIEKLLSALLTKKTSKDNFKITFPANTVAGSDGQVWVETVRPTDPIAQKKLFFSDSKVILTYNNDLNRLRLPSERIKITPEQFQTTENSKIKKSSKYEFLFKAIKESNPLTELSLNDININPLNTDNKKIKMTGKSVDKSLPEVLNFKNSRIVTLDVKKPKTEQSATEKPKTDLKRLITDKNHGSFKISPLKFDCFDNKINQCTIKSDNFSSCLDKIEDLRGKYFTEIHYENKIVNVKIKPENQKEFNQDSIILNFDNNLEDLRLPTEKIKLTQQQYSEMKNNYNTDSKKYNFIFQEIEKLNPIEFFSAEDFVIDIDDVQKEINLKGKKFQDPVTHKEILNFENSAIVKLDVEKVPNKVDNKTETTQTKKETSEISWWLYGGITFVFVAIGFIAFRSFKNRQ